jgi:hypothetical protein
MILDDMGSVELPKLVKRVRLPSVAKAKIFLNDRYPESILEIFDKSKPPL